MVSLLKLANITEQGVSFQSHHDGTPMHLTLEHSIALQNTIGSDIIMQLDDVLIITSPDAARMGEAMERNVRWLNRYIAAHANPTTRNLFYATRFNNSQVFLISRVFILPANSYYYTLALLSVF